MRILYIGKEEDIFFFQSNKRIELSKPIYSFIKFLLLIQFNEVVCKSWLKCVLDFCVGLYIYNYASKLKGKVFSVHFSHYVCTIRSLYFYFLYLNFAHSLHNKMHLLWIG